MGGQIAPRFKVPAFQHRACVFIVQPAGQLLGGKELF
jgi:hypothetical protein